MPRKAVQLGNDGVSGLIGIAWRSVALGGPSSQFAVSRTTTRLSAARDGAKQRRWIDFNFILTVRANNLHAANLTYRLLCAYRNFKVAHYPRVAVELAIAHEIAQPVALASALNVEMPLLLVI